MQPDAARTASSQPGPAPPAALHPDDELVAALPPELPLPDVEPLPLEPLVAPESVPLLPPVAPESSLVPPPPSFGVVKLQLTPTQVAPSP